MLKRAPSLRILLVDDHELVRRGIRELLRAKSSWKVVAEAADGIAAIEKARVLKPDIVILDIGMPGLDGLKAAPQIRDAAPNTKIIVLTLHESGEMLRRALEAGALGVVLKSDLGDRLVAALNEISHGRHFLTSKACDLVVRSSLPPETDKRTHDASRQRPTPREAEVICLLAEGKANKEIAAALGISVRTAEAHRAHLMKKLSLHSLAEVIHYALRHGIATTKPPESKGPEENVPPGRVGGRHQWGS
jgi:DNA-binding NarL/FixJ family response regulator